MQLAEFTISGLFETLNHHIAFPSSENTMPRPSVTILHGANGVGKTTVLRMLEGLMNLDFNIFRRMPFAECSLRFNNGDIIRVWPQDGGKQRALTVTFGNHSVQLHPHRPGALHDEDRAIVEKFRETFFLATESLNFEFIDTARVAGIFGLAEEESDALSGYRHLLSTEIRNLSLHMRSPNPKARPSEISRDLAYRVQRFVREAQGNYRRFFATTQPELFPRILDRLTENTPRLVTPDDLLFRLRKIQQEDQDATRFGLELEPWDYTELAGSLKGERHETGFDHVLAVLDTYVETLESRAAQRRLIVDRLRTFERLMSEFFENKTVKVSAQKGFEIVTSRGKLLRENQLSSGEYHLLYLMVTALVTQRRGAVIAIDEPEMSMHLKWQRNLIRALIECASNAEPQFIFATHSPDIAADYQDYLIPLSASELSLTTMG